MLRGLQRPEDQPPLHRYRGEVLYDGSELRVTFPRHAHNPVLRSVPCAKLPDRISWLDNARLRFA
jgi:hypothetical protein